MRAVQIALTADGLAAGANVAPIAQTAGTPREPPPIKAGVAPPAGPYAPGIDVRHYDVELGLSADGTTFEARVIVDVTTTAAGATLPLDFTGLAVTAVRVNGRDDPYSYADGLLRIPLPDTVAGGLAAVECATPARQTMA